MSKIELEKIGYYKYKSNISSSVDCIKEYPITVDILEYIEKNCLSLKIELDGENPVKIDGKYVILI